MKISTMYEKALVGLVVFIIVIIFSAVIISVNALNVPAKVDPTALPFGR